MRAYCTVFLFMQRLHLEFNSRVRYDYNYWYCTSVLTVCTVRLPLAVVLLMATSIWKLTAALRPGKLKKASGPCLCGIWFSTDNILTPYLGCTDEKKNKKTTGSISSLLHRWPSQYRLPQSDNFTGDMWTPLSLTQRPPSPCNMLKSNFNSFTVML